MKLYVYIIFFPLIVYSQTKKIYLFDNNNLPINNFEITLYSSNSILTIKKNKENFFEAKNIYNDSIIINYNSFYNKKLINCDLKENDTIYLDNTVSIKEVFLNKKLNQLIKTNGKIHKFSTGFNSEKIIRIDIKRNQSMTIDYISFFILKKFKNSFISDKFMQSNGKKFELILFQSNGNPNEKIENLLKKSYILDIKGINKKGWYRINLSNLELTLNDYKYLYVGYKCLDNILGIGHSKIKKNKEFKVYYRTTNRYYPNKWHINGGSFIPSIKVGLKE